MPASNGMPADQLRVTWRKSKWSNPSGNCVEVAALRDGAVAVPQLAPSVRARAGLHSRGNRGIPGRGAERRVRRPGLRMATAERLSEIRKAGAGQSRIE
jgi:hypothetical protein